MGAMDFTVVDAAGLVELVALRYGAPLELVLLREAVAGVQPVLNLVVLLDVALLQVNAVEEYRKTVLFEVVLLLIGNEV